MYNNIRILLIWYIIFTYITISSAQTQRIFCSVCSCRGDYISCARGLPPPHRILKATRTGNSILLVRSDFMLYKTFKPSIDRLFKSVIVLDGSRQTGSIRTPATQTTRFYSTTDLTIKNTTPTSLPSTPLISTPQETALYEDYTLTGHASPPSSEGVSGIVEGFYSLYTPPTLATPALTQEPLIHQTRGTSFERGAVTVEERGYFPNPSHISDHSHEGEDLQGSNLLSDYHVLLGVVIGFIAGVLLSVSFKYLYPYCFKGPQPRPRIVQDNLDTERGRDIIEMDTF